MLRFSFAFIVALVFMSGNLFGQKHPDFTITHQVKTTPVKSQDNTGTCWAYTTVSFVETEALRKGKKMYDLSEMYIVRQVYPVKADYFVRLHGLGNFSQGGQAHDVTNAVEAFGIVPQSIYPGLPHGQIYHNHTKLEKYLKYIVEDAAEEKERLNDSWKYMFNGVLDAHLGKLPESFEFDGKTYTPKTFANEALDFQPADYVEFTSYMHHPYYSKFDLEVPDNWSHDDYYNLPIDELMSVLDYALENGYSVAWDGDVSEDGFNHLKGRAELSEIDEKHIKAEGVQQYRQDTFDNFTTTDDHLMHIVGLAEDAEGNKYYLTKNSWGNSNNYGGYLYMSEDFVKIKTIAFMVHKDAVPKETAKQIGL